MKQSEVEGGMQFYSEISSLEMEAKDELGRGYITPPMGTDNGKVLQIIAEPLEIFLDPERTLLAQSRNPWAIDYEVRLTLELLIKKLDHKRNQYNPRFLKNIRHLFTNSISATQSKGRWS